jgi:hypothetical protein
MLEVTRDRYMKAYTKAHLRWSQMKKLWTRKLCVSSKQTNLLFGHCNPRWYAISRSNATYQTWNAPMSDQVRKQTIQKCFCELDKLSKVRPNLSGQDVIGWKSGEHESSSFFWDEQLWSLRNFDPRLFPTSEQACKVQTSFWTNSFGKFGPTHPNSTQTRILDVNPALFLARVCKGC